MRKIVMLLMLIVSLIVNVAYAKQHVLLEEGPTYWGIFFSKTMGTIVGAVIMLGILFLFSRLRDLFKRLLDKIRNKE